jgi:raffinose/stachyose/melibiose transport system substrate-binding protein
MRAQHRSIRAAVLLAAASLIVAACGSDDDESDASATASETSAAESSAAESSAPAESSAADTGEAAAPAGVLDPATVGDATLEVWTAEGGKRLELVQQRVDAFHEAYPNVTVNLTVREFGSYPAQLKLAMDSDDAPDVAIGNIGYSLDGPLIEAGLIRELTPWAEAYGWDTRYPEDVQRQLRFSTDGKEFGNGPMYGVPYASDVIGWFYNKEKLAALGLEEPQTFAELEAALAAAKEAGETPIMFGNLEQWPGLHLFFTVNSNTATPDDINGIVFGQEGASWTSDGMIAAAAKVAEWGELGYYVDGYNGLAPADAGIRFGEGEGLFAPGGSWGAADIGTALGDNVGFFVTPPNEAGGPRYATGSFGYGWHISTKSEQPDLAAAFIEWMTNVDAERLFVESGDLGALPVPDAVVPTGVAVDIQEAFDQLLADDALLTYLDFADPNGGEVLYPTIQEIISGDVAPEDGLARIEAARQEFLATRG